MEHDDIPTVVHVKMPKSLRAKGHKKSKEMGLTLSAYLRILLKNGLDDHGSLTIPAPISKRRSA